MSEGTVRARNVNLRKSPKTGTVIKQLRRNSRVEVLGEEAWYRVRTTDGKVGFVLGDFVGKEVGLTPSAPPDEVEGVSDQCVLGVFAHARFVGKELVIDQKFFPSLDRLNRYEPCLRNRPAMNQEYALTPTPSPRTTHSSSP